MIPVLINESVGLESNVGLGKCSIQAAGGHRMASGDEIDVVGALMVVGILGVVVGAVVGE